MKGGDILDFQKGGNLRKGGYDPPTNYDSEKTSLPVLFSLKQKGR